MKSPTPSSVNNVLRLICLPIKGLGGGIRVSCHSRCHLRNCFAKTTPLPYVAAKISESWIQLPRPLFISRDKSDRRQSVRFFNSPVRLFLFTHNSKSVFSFNI